MGAALSANLLTLFVFYEIMTFSTYPLVTHHGTEAARRGGRTYLGILLFTSIAFLMLAIVWTWEVAGTLEFRPGGILREAWRQAADQHARRLGVLAGLVRLRNGQGRADAVSSLAARGDGGAHARQRAVARRGRRQGGRLHRHEGHSSTSSGSICCSERGSASG